jgi:glycosyltransferase involved in cell wall biosynthesis
VAEPFRVLATCGVFEPGYRGGGPVRSVAHIVDTAPPTVEVSLLTSDRDFGAPSPYPGLSGRWVGRGRSRVFYLATGHIGQWLRLLRELRSTRFDLLYVNSLWSPRFTIAPVLAARLGLLRIGRVLIAPRGELSPGALTLKSFKKRLFLRLWSPLLRGMGTVWHASADREAAEIRAACPWARVEVNGDQVDLPLEPIPGDGPHDGPARLVFLGRIAPKKNLLAVLSALLHVEAPVTFDIYGPVEDEAYWEFCEVLIAKLPPHIRVTYRGPVAPAVACDTFCRYDAFVFPTLGENFGHVIAESLCASCPVVCTDSTPWTPVLNKGGGTVLTSLDALPAELSRLASLSPAARWDSRLAAAAAYRTWRATRTEGNILEQARTAPWAAP